MNTKKKKFIEVPNYDEGNEGFRKLIEENLVYPEEAIKNNIEGIVHLVYEVKDSGEIFNVKVVKGIGYGCDEEAVRIIKLMKFGKVKNKGMRVKVSRKARVLFKLPKTETKIVYNLKPDEKEDSTNQPKPKNEIIYNWNITIS